MEFILILKIDAQNYVLIELHCENLDLIIKIIEGLKKWFLFVQKNVTQIFMAGNYLYVYIYIYMYIKNFTLQL